MSGASATGRMVRVIDLETAGSGPADVCEIGWQDVAEGEDGVWRLAGESGARLANPGRPISPDTMVVHHITDEAVRGAPFWKTAAEDILRPHPPVAALAAHRTAFEQRFCTPRLTGGADWICSWKCARRLRPELPRFSNQMLRYLRRPEGLVHERGLPAHRAFPDACAGSANPICARSGRSKCPLLWVLQNRTCACSRFDLIKANGRGRIQG